MMTLLLAKYSDSTSPNARLSQSVILRTCKKSRMLFRYFGIVEASPMRKFRTTEYLVRDGSFTSIPSRRLKMIEHLLAFLWVDASEFVAFKVVLYNHKFFPLFCWDCHSKQ